MPVVNIPGVGQVNFPDTMSGEQINVAAARLYNEKQQKPAIDKAAQEEQSNWLTNPTAENLATGALKGLKGAGEGVLDMVKTPFKLAMHPQKTLEDATAARYQNWNEGDKELQKAQGFADTTGALAKKYIGGTIPLVGPALVATGENLGSGDPERMGHGAVDAAAMAYGASPTARGAVNNIAKKVPAGVSNAVTTVQNSPAAMAAIGGAAGYLEGGWPMAVRGVAGGGTLGTVNRLIKAYTQANAPKTPKAPKVVEVLNPQPAPKVDPVARGMATMSEEIPKATEGAEPGGWGAVNRIGRRAEQDFDANQTLRTGMNPPSPNAGGTLRPGSNPVLDALNELRQPQQPNSVELPPQAKGLPPTASSDESIARALIQQRTTPEEQMIRGHQWQGEDAANNPPQPPEPKAVSSIARKMSESAGYQPPSIEPEVAAPSAVIPPSTSRRTPPSAIKGLTQNDIQALKEALGSDAKVLEHLTNPTTETQQIIEAARKVRSQGYRSDAGLISQLKKILDQENK